MSLTGGTKLGPYDIVALLGVGGMGEFVRMHPALHFMEGFVQGLRVDRKSLRQLEQFEMVLHHL